MEFFLLLERQISLIQVKSIFDLTMENETLEADDPSSLRPHVLENRNRQHQIFIYLAKIIRIYMQNYLKTFFEQDILIWTLFITGFR